MKTRASLLSIAALAAACSGDDGSNGKNSLVVTTDEPSGDNCPNGGLRVDTGLDANGNGELDESEQGTPSYVCTPDAPAAGDGGTRTDSGTDGSVITGSYSLNAGTVDATQCPEGGRSLQLIGPDGEPVGDPVAICAATVASTQGNVPVAKAYRGADVFGPVASEGQAGTEPVFTTPLSLTVPHKGFIVAVGSSLAYCSSPADPNLGACATGPSAPTAAWLTIVDASSANQAGNSGQGTVLFGLQPNIDSQLSVTAIFDIPEGGTYSYNLLGMAADSTPNVDDTKVYYGGSELTLFFVPRS